MLLCEDEAPLRALLERMLGRAGYRVAAAVDAAHALELADGLEGAYDMLVTDVVMPGGSGLDLADELARRDGARPLLLISGFNAETVDRRAACRRGAPSSRSPSSRPTCSRPCGRCWTLPVDDHEEREDEPAATMSTPESASAA